MSGATSLAETPFPVSTVTSTKNLHEILKKLSVEEKNKAHDFWDSQPVPKLGGWRHTRRYATIAMSSFYR